MLVIGDESCYGGFPVLSHADNILQTVRDPLLVLDGDLRVTSVNRSFDRSFRIPPEQATGRFLYDLGNGQWNIPELRTLLENVVGSDSAFDDYQVEHDFPDIGRRTMLLSARRLHDGDPLSRLILLAIEDITGRRPAASPPAPPPAAADDHANRYRTLFELSPVAVYSCDSAGVIQEFNHRAAELWGREPVVGDTNERFCGSVKMLHPDGTDLPHAACPLADVLSGKIQEVRDAEVVIERPDGSRITVVVNIRPLTDKQGKITGVINCFYDITQRERTEHLLHASEIRYRRLFEAAHDGILILNTTSRTITDVNPFLTELLGYPREHFVGKELWEIGIFRDKAANQQAMQQLHERGSIRFEDLPLQDRNGHRHPVEIVANIYQEDRAPVIQCNIRDIGERVQFERQREALLVNEQASRMEAEAANRAKDLFLATLSHEVRTPLNAILGWATILRDGSASPADLREGMAVIERNCIIQSKLIDDVLDISRIVSGKLQLQIRACELADVIHAAVDVVRPSIEAKGVLLEVSIDPEVSHAACDKNRMQQVVWNLLSNAVKFTPRGKTIRVTLTRERPSTARIQVSDEGMGINAKLLPYVFDRFRQGDSSTRRTYGGLGLGLSIVKHIVEAHGGTVHAASAGADRGATFIVNLPVRAIQMNEGAYDRRSSDSGGNGTETESDSPQELMAIRLDGLRVLVVDDEPDARRLIEKVLGDVGAVVTPASSVAEAMAMLAITRPQILLSDIAMPTQDGYDLIRQVRGAEYSAKDLPAVALTAFAQRDDRLKALLAGFQVHVAKPIDPHELIAVIASLVGRTG